MKVCFLSPFQRAFGVTSIADSEEQLNSALYLQVSIISQALIFVTRSRSWSYVERPGFLLVGAFLAAQLVSFFLPNMSSRRIHQCKQCFWF